MKMKESVFSHSLKMAKDSAARIEFGSLSWRHIIIIRIRMSFIGQVCLHIRGICYSDKAPQCNRMTATGQDTDNKRTIYN